MTTKEMFKTEFNSKEVIAFFKELEKKFKDLTPLMKTAKVFLKNAVDENFETEGEYSGEKWKAWSDAWKKRRLKLGRSEGRILNLDGHLRRSMIGKSGKDFALVGTNKEYAAIHNFGGAPNLKKNKTMPKREFMRLSDYNKEELIAELYIKAEEMTLESIAKEIKEG